PPRRRRCGLLRRVPSVTGRRTHHWCRARRCRAHRPRVDGAHAHAEPLRRCVPHHRTGWQWPRECLGWMSCLFLLRCWSADQRVYFGCEPRTADVASSTAESTPVRRGPLTKAVIFVVSCATRLEAWSRVSIPGAPASQRRASSNRRMPGSSGTAASASPEVRTESEI